MERNLKVDLSFSLTLSSLLSSPSLKKNEEPYDELVVKKALNFFLRSDEISILEVKKVPPEFHARFVLFFFFSAFFLSGKLACPVQ